MRITAVECDVLLVPEYDQASVDTSQDDLLVRVHTDSGVTGIGEVESNPWVIRALIECPGSNLLNRGLAELLVGQDPTQPMAVWEDLYRGSLLVGRRGAGICAIGALDMAVWDICGRATGQPIWRLLGGTQRTEITPYASLLPSGKDLKEYERSLLAKAEWARAAGFHAVKAEILVKGPLTTDFVVQHDDVIIDLVKSCREVLGSGVQLMVDVGYCWEDWKEALNVARAIEKYDLFFLETPLLPDDLEGYACLSRAAGIRIAAGELLQTRFEFIELMDHGCVDVVQPDVGRVGGVTEALRVARLAEERGKLVVLHCWKTGIGIAATAHVAAVSGNCPFIEYLPAEVSDSRLRRELVSDELRVENGKLRLPQRPGLGVELNMEAVKEFSVTAEKYSPTTLWNDEARCLVQKGVSGGIL